MGMLPNGYATLMGCWVVRAEGSNSDVQRVRMTGTTDAAFMDTCIRAFNYSYLRRASLSALYRMGGHVPMTTSYDVVISPSTVPKQDNSVKRDSASMGKVDQPCGPHYFIVVISSRLLLLGSDWDV